MDLAQQLNRVGGGPEDVQAATRRVLRSLFPPWLPGAFKAMFSRPFPELSCRMNAWVTALTCQWLMGPSAVNDVELGDGTVLRGQGVKVERCRFLEEAGCAAVCVNSCKLPTQTFFAEDMGLPLAMAPNYDDFSCQFSFGVQPAGPEEEAEVFSTPCFAGCPSKRAAWAAGGGPAQDPQQQCPNVTPP
eukprot:CAMPEP_0119138312 /NCGR_PEP_ID=MMETSP1310-20130426/25412_1 /TAXON_ID=464262 /ORGANISM="Genus nov. species nov., Strain RCC2339" /LENGTH=187 /DNA_ID=CAMNT_0007129491 /DNA_START=1 /DNA_END=564 /DNA_ORIENTATION=-